MSPAGNGDKRGSTKTLFSHAHDYFLSSLFPFVFAAAAAKKSREEMEEGWVTVATVFYIKRPYLSWRGHVYEKRDSTSR